VVGVEQARGSFSFHIYKSLMLKRDNKKLELSLPAFLYFLILEMNILINKKYFYFSQGGKNAEVK